MLYHPPPEKGQGLVEYALILVLIAVVVVAVLVAFGPFLGDLYSSVSIFSHLSLFSQHSSNSIFIAE